MHGRVKVKSTAQQEEEKRKEREQKLKVYLTVQGAIFKKRSNNELDEEALQLSQQLLASNPDFGTLWNYRREILLQLETAKEEEEMQKLYEAELLFIESCLKANPKSYGSWHHRGWVSSRLPKPDWKRELSLCDRCLSLDDRNFHCWDYRRIVVKASDVSVDQELQFTEHLISSNFSNYSSWHYRSTLLPLLSDSPPADRRNHAHTRAPPTAPHHTRGHRVSDEKLLKEYQLVQNAVFTDPNDQSAWFYYRWLLGRAERDELISCVYVSREGERVAAAFSKPLNAVSVMLVLDGKPQQVKWRRVHPDVRHSSVWVCELPPGSISDINNEHNLTVHWPEKHTQKDCALYTGRMESWCRDSATDQELFRSELSVEKTSVLQSELQSCAELLELEPRNKWCLLTIVLLMRALDPLGHEKETLAHFQTLKEVDPMRSAYYSDLCSKFMMENTILKMEYAEVRVFSLSDKSLSTLCHLDQLLLVTHMDLRSNRLAKLPPQFAALRCLQVLEADDNAIATLDGLYRLPKLEEVSLKNNHISRISDLSPLATCPALGRLDLRGNPITRTDNIRAEISEMLPSLTELLL